MKLLLIEAVLAAFLAMAAATAPASDASQAKAQQKGTAYKPAQPPPATGNATKPSDPEAYDKEVQAANEQRDKDLAEASKIADRRTFEKRRGEIMAQHLAIMAKLREKYMEAVDEGKVQPPPPPPKQTVAKANRNDTKTKKSGGLLASLLGGGKSSKSGKSSGTPGDGLSDAQAKLDAENQRHSDALDDLNKQLKAAQASGNKREIRKAERAIEKENAAYEDKKAKLERAVVDAGGQLDSPADRSKQTTTKSKSRK
jgi:hypothetical protein